MKLPIAGQTTPQAERTFSAAHSLSRALVIVADPGISTWTYLDGIDVPILRVSEAENWSKRPLASPMPHHEVAGTPAAITGHLADERCVLLGDWVASWAEVACRVWLTRAGIRRSDRTSTPWDLVLSDARPRVIQSLLHKIP